MTLPLKALLASGALILSSGAAFAATATATTDLNVRSGPGTGYEIVDTLPAGETVNLIGCDGAWCEISMGRESGFAAESYLERAGYSRARVIVEDDEPEIITGLAIGGYYESRPYYIRDGYYYWGGRWYGNRPGRPGWRDRSFRRWEERREARLDNRRERLDDRRERFQDRRERFQENRAERRENFQERRERFQDRRDDRRERVQDGRGGDRGERMQERAERGGGDRMQARAERGGGGDRGDRMGLDRAGGGGRGDGGGRSDGGGAGRGDGGGRGGDGGGRGGDGGGRGGGGGGGGGRGDR